MRATPKTSVLGEGGRYCIGGKGTSKDHKTEEENISWNGSPFTDACWCAWARQRWRSGPRIPSCWSRRPFPGETCQSRKMGPVSSGLNLQTPFRIVCGSFCKDCNSFRRKRYSIRIVLWLSPQTLSAKLFLQNTFRKLLEIKSGNNRAPF